MESKIQGRGYIEEEDDTILFWRIETLWCLAEALPVENLRLEEIYWAEDSCGYLEKDDTYLNFAVHVKRVLDSDLSYPIILSPNGNVMDGMHRLIKAYVFGVPMVQAVRFLEMPPPDVVEAITVA